MNKTSKLLLIIIIILVVAIGATYLWQKTSKKSAFHAVYLETGDLYFGKLVRFPHFGLKNIYVLQINTGDPENPISIQKFVNLFWAPQDYMKLNRNKVIWTVGIEGASDLAKLLRTNPILLPPAGQAPGPGAGAPVGEGAPAIEE